MFERYGRKGTDHDGIFFTEGIISSGSRIRDLQVESRKQNVNLDQLKTELAKQVKQLGGNALDNFNYVQQGTVFSFSSTRWRVSGTAVRATEETAG